MSVQSKLSSQRAQIVKPRDEKQRFQRTQPACITCGEPREARSNPVCPKCTERAA